MLKQHIKIAWRQLMRRKLYTGLNLLGLTIGLSTALLLLLFVRYEHRHDAAMVDAENTYRMYRQWDPTAGGLLQVPMAAATDIREEVPGLIASSYLWDWGQLLFRYQANRHYLPRVAATDSLWLQTVQMPLLAGDPASALREPTSIVLSASAAHRFFGNETALGKVVHLDGEEPYTVTGVFADDHPSHLQYDAYIHSDLYLSEWLNNSANVYLRLHPEASIAQVEETIAAVAEEPMLAGFQQIGMDISRGELPAWRLQPLLDIHLGSATLNNFADPTGRRGQVRIFGLVALLALLLAAINYTNLSTALAARRAKEIGVRKVSGASFGQMVRQLLTESLVQVSLAGLLAVGLAYTALPYFNQLIDRPLDMADWLQGWSPALFGGLLLVLALMAGAYPAFYLARLEPTESLKNKLNFGQGGQLRKVLVTLQFTVASVLLLVVGMIYLQVNFVQDQALGFDQEQVVVTALHTEGSYERFESRREALIDVAGVQAVDWTNGLPGSINWTNNFAFPGRTNDVWAFYYNAGNALDDVLGIEMAQGRYFDPLHPADTLGFVVNETFVDHYALEEPIGHPLRMVADTAFGTIIGVMKDFHFESLESPLKPLVAVNRPNWLGSEIAMKLSTSDLPETLASIEGIWAGIEPEHPFQFTFLDEDFAQQYSAYERFGQTILSATGLMILIAALGLFGLATFSAEQRTKELGIRKVLGASLQQLISLLAKDYVRLVSIALLVAAPIGWYVANSWLQNFAYRLEVQWWLLPLMGLLLLCVAGLSVGSQAVRAAVGNPVDALRSE